MAFKIGDRIAVVSTTTGIGTYSLGAALTGYRTFLDAGVSSGDTVPYVVVDSLQSPTKWEKNRGVVTAGSPPTLTRIVEDSSSGGTAINWTEGQRFIFCAPGAKNMLAFQDVTDLSSVRAAIGLGGAATLAVGTSAGTVAAGDHTHTGVYQPADSELTAIAGLTSAADRVPYFTGSGTAALATFTSAGRALVDDADAAAQRATLGLGTSATVNTGTGSSDVPTTTQADARYARLAGAAFTGPVSGTAFTLNQVKYPFGYESSVWVGGQAGYRFNLIGSCIFDGTNFVANSGLGWGSNNVSCISIDVNGLSFMHSPSTGPTERSVDPTAFNGMARFRATSSGVDAVGVPFRMGTTTVVDTNNDFYGRNLNLTGTLTSRTAVVADDAVWTVAAPNTQSQTALIVGNSSAAEFVALVVVRTITTKSVVALFAGSLTTVSQSVLSGTTGTDGRLTIGQSSTDGSFTVENRTGSSRNISVTFLG